MIGNRARVITVGDEPAHQFGCVEGVLKKIDPAGVYLWRQSPAPPADVFIPMIRVIEVVDLGRAP